MFVGSHVSAWMSRYNQYGKNVQGDECRWSLFLHPFLFLQDERETWLEMICLLGGSLSWSSKGRGWCKGEQACRPFPDVGGPLTAFSEAAAHGARNGFWCLCVETATPWQGCGFNVRDGVLPHSKEGCSLWPWDLRTASPLNPQVRRNL